MSEKGANIESCNKKGYTALFYAFKRYQYDQSLKDIIKILIGLGADYTAETSLLLYIAADKNNDVEFTRYLFESGLPIDQKFYNDFLTNNKDIIPKIEIFRLALIADTLLKENNIEDVVQNKNLLKKSLETLFTCEINHDNGGENYHKILSLIKNRLHANMLKINKTNIIEQYKVLRKNIDIAGLNDLYFNQKERKIVEYKNKIDPYNGDNLTKIICDEYFPSLKLITIDNIAINLSKQNNTNYCLNFFKRNILPTDLHEELFKSLKKHLSRERYNEVFESMHKQKNIIELQSKECLGDQEYCTESLGNKM